MSKVKLCGLTRPEDILAVNELLPDYIGFVFAEKSKRYVDKDKAASLKQLLDPRVLAVGVFVNESPETVAMLLNCGTIDLAQLHGSEDELYIQDLRTLTDRPLIQAFRISAKEDLQKALASTADLILLDSGAGTGTLLDWSLLEDMDRPYFLAGGLDPDNVSLAIKKLHPFACDVSSGIETAGSKDNKKMTAFVQAVRKE